MGKKSKEKSAIDLVLDARKRVAALRVIADRLEAEVNEFDGPAAKPVEGINLTLYGKGDSPQLLVAMLVERVCRDLARAGVAAPDTYEITLRRVDGEWEAKARWVQ